MSALPAIRVARKEDLGAVQDIVEAAYTIYIERIGRRPAPMDDDHAAQIACGQVHVLDEEEIPGLVVLAEPDGEFVLHNVAVRPGRQGAGLGRALIGFAEDEARRRGHGRVVLYTHVLMTENQALYESLGYRPIEHDDEAGIPRVFMAKDV